MSTLADLFNNRISLNRRVILAERLKEDYLIYFIPLKGEEPLKVEIFSVEKSMLEKALSEHGVLKEDIYVILHPALYYKNSIQLPFLDLQKIESIIDNEVVDYLPYKEIEHINEGIYEDMGKQEAMEVPLIVDFDIFYQRVIAYAVETRQVSGILKELGKYAEGLKAIVPYGSILRDFFISSIILENDFKIIMLECSSDGMEVWGFSKDINGELVQNINCSKDSIDIDRVLSAILRVKKYYKEGRYLYFSKIDCKIAETIIKDTLDRIGLRYYRNDLNETPASFPGYIINEHHRHTLYSFLYFYRKKGKKINLLKGPFKPSIKNYIRVKDFVLAGVLILLLLGFSAGRFLTDVSFLRSRVNQLKNSISRFTEQTFGEKISSVKSAVKLLNSIKNESQILERNINRRYSALELFKELTSALPVDVELEYTDILIDQNRIRFNGKTKSFSDIDKIKESLQNSEYFKEVNVTNSGTTGSTGGFIVNFQFDIKCSIK